MTSVAIIDYQLSNLFSVKHACCHVGLDAEITSDPKVIKQASGAILPGVGAFGDAMSSLEKLNLTSAIKDFIASGKPFMGICLGLQLLFTKSEEFGIHNGLDIIKGNVVKFKNGIKVPQIGWNTIHSPSGQDLWERSPLRGIAEGEYMYFVHSFYVAPEDPDMVLTKTEYEEISYCSGIHRDNVFAVQFHPEKSGEEGIKIYRNWGSLVKNHK